MNNVFIGIGIMVLTIASGEFYGVLHAAPGEQSVIAQADQVPSGPNVKPPADGPLLGDEDSREMDHSKGGPDDELRHAPKLVFDNENAAASWKKTHELLRSLHETIHGICGPDKALHDEMHSKIEALHEDVTLDRAARKAKASEIFASYKTRLEAARAAAKSCLDANSAVIEPIKTEAKALTTACFGEAMPRHPAFAGPDKTRPEGEAHIHGRRGHHGRPDLTAEMKADLESSLSSDACSAAQAQVTTSLSTIHK